MAHDRLEVDLEGYLECAGDEEQPPEPRKPDRCRSDDQRDQKEQACDVWPVPVLVGGTSIDDAREPGGSGCGDQVGEQAGERAAIRGRGLGGVVDGSLVGGLHPCHSCAFCCSQHKRGMEGPQRVPAPPVCGATGTHPTRVARCNATEERTAEDESCNTAPGGGQPHLGGAAGHHRANMSPSARHSPRSVRPDMYLHTDTPRGT